MYILSKSAAQILASSPPVPPRNSIIAMSEFINWKNLYLLVYFGIFFCLATHQHFPKCFGVPDFFLSFLFLFLFQVYHFFLLFCCFLPFLESFDTAQRIHILHLTGIKRMAFM